MHNGTISSIGKSSSTTGISKCINGKNICIMDMSLSVILSICSIDIICINSSSIDINLILLA